MGPDKQMRWFVIVGSQRIFQINELIHCSGSYPGQATMRRKLCHSHSCCMTAWIPTTASITRGSDARIIGSGMNI